MKEFQQNSLNRLPLNSKLIGFAACALIVPQENPSAHRCVDPAGTCEILWRLEATYTDRSFYRDLSQIVSDHLLLVVVPVRSMPHPCHEFTFDFEIKGDHNRCKKVKKCGARALFEHDKEELISKMKQSQSSISVHKATDEQEGSMGSGGSDDEYISAEE